MDGTQMGYTLKNIDMPSETLNLLLNNMKFEMFLPLNYFSTF